MIKNPFRILISALLVAWILDTLFWRQSFGISFPIFVGMLLIVGFALAFSELKPAARPSLWILVPIVVLAFVPAIRLEPITRFMAVSMTLVCLMIMAHTFRGGRWLSYSFSDYAAMPFRLLAGMITGAPQVYKQGVKDQDQGSDFLKPLHSLLPVIKGLLLALPLLLIFSVLLASADAIFAHRLRDFFQHFNLEKLFEYLFRGFYILVLGYVLTGIYLYALTKSQDERLIGLEKPVAQPFIGWIEACVVLASVNLLFIMFVIIQFQYFFGGGGNIHIDGLTYAQYARPWVCGAPYGGFFQSVALSGSQRANAERYPSGP